MGFGIEKDDRKICGLRVTGCGMRVTGKKGRGQRAEGREQKAYKSIRKAECGGKAHGVRYTK